MVANTELWTDDSGRLRNKRGQFASAAERQQYQQSQQPQSSADLTPILSKLDAISTELADLKREQQRSAGKSTTGGWKSDVNKLLFAKVTGNDKEFDKLADRLSKKLNRQVSHTKDQLQEVAIEAGLLAIIGVTMGLATGGLVLAKAAAQLIPGCQWFEGSCQSQSVSETQLSQVVRIRMAIAGQESGGDATAENRSGSGATGSTQIMPENLDSWGRQCVGKPVTQAELKASIDLQNKITDCKIQEYLDGAIGIARGEEELVRMVAVRWYGGDYTQFNDETPQYFNGDVYPSRAEYTKQVWEKYKQIKASSPEVSTANGRVFPIAGQSWETAEKTSSYGNRNGGFHYGQDLAAPVGTPIVATESGKIDEILSADDGNACGNGIGIDFGNNTGVRYCHLSSVNVAMGQQVKAGEVIGLTGNTGRSTGPHLHFEFVQNGTSVDPTEYLNSIGTSSGAKVLPTNNGDPIVNATQQDSTSAVFCVDVLLEDGSTKCATAVAITPTRLITANHVTNNNGTVKIRSTSGQEFTAGVIKFDASLDLALLEVPGVSLPVMPIGNGVSVGDSVKAMGHEHGAPELTVRPTTVIATDVESNVKSASIGLPSGAITDGFSGGALTKNGYLVGVNQAMAKVTGEGRAIPIDIIKQFAGL